MSSKNRETETITIKPPNIKLGSVWIKGTAPLVVHKFSIKAKHQIEAMQSAGTTARSKRERKSKDFNEAFNDARHISLDGWDGFPAAAIRCACITACKLVGYKMTIAKMSVFILEDGWDADEGTPLVKIYGGSPRRLDSMVRVGGITKVVDISVRPQWLEWGACVRFKYDADQFTASDVLNLLSRAGAQVGICEGRPSSTVSCGMGWGTFEISTEEEVRAIEARAAKAGGAE